MIETDFIEKSRKILLLKWRFYSIFIILILDAFIFVINWIFPTLFNCLDFLDGSSPIGWGITILGFTITARNILFSIRNDNYLNISMKDILEGNVKCLDKFLWYIILFMPLNMLFFYLLHSKKCLWLFVLISLISMLMYFHDVLTRMNSHECLKEISNNIQIYLIQDENDFSNSIIEKVSNSNSNIKLLTIEKRISDGLYSKLIKRPVPKGILSSFTEYYTYKTLKYANYESNILNNVIEYSLFIAVNISKISSYDFVFFKWIENKYIDFEKKLKKIEDKGFNQKFNLIEKYIIKYLFGIYLAAFINFDLSYNKKIYRNFLNNKRFEYNPLLKQKIKAVILLVVNYSILNQLSECDFFESNCRTIFSMFSDNITANDIIDLKNDIFNVNEPNLDRFVKQKYNISDVLIMMEKQLENEFSIRLLYGTKYVNEKEK